MANFPPPGQKTKRKGQGPTLALLPPSDQKTSTKSYLLRFPLLLNSTKLLGDIPDLNGSTYYVLDTGLGAVGTKRHSPHGSKKEDSM